MVEPIGRGSYFPIMNCASWSVLQYFLQERGQTEVDGDDNEWAGLGSRMQDGLG